MNAPDQPSVSLGGHVLMEGPMRFTVRTKLFGGFAVVIVLLIVASVVSISAMGGINSKTKTIAEGDVPSTRVIGELNGATSDVRAMLFKQISQDERADMLATGKS